MRPRDQRAFVRRHKVLLVSLFGLFVLFGLWFGNLPALGGGGLGLGWVYARLRAKG